MKSRANLRRYFAAHRLLPIAALAVSALIALAWSAGSRWQAPEALLPERSALAAGSLLVRPALPDAQGTVSARPLFAPDRRPPAAEPTPASVAEDNHTPELLDQAKLVGVLGVGVESVAVVHLPAGSRRLRIGEELGGWRLVSIDTLGASFEREIGDRETPRIEERQLPFVRKPKPLVGKPPRAHR